MSRPWSVLIVDDNRDAGDLLGEVLAALGYSIRVVHDSNAALAAVEQLVPDAALLDIGLPEIDGYELARMLHERWPALCLIAITGYGQPADRERALATGFTAHMTKPVSITDLVATLELYCGNTPSRG
ncbi:MAG TPA: response regulator [Kofleriaceae bacterium]